MKPAETSATFFAKATAFPPVKDLTGFVGRFEPGVTLSEEEVSGYQLFMMNTFRSVKEGEDSPLGDYLRGDFKKVYSYLTGFFTGKAVGIAMSYRDKEPAALKKLMNAQLAALCGHFAEVEKEALSEMGNGLFYVVDHFLLSTEQRAEYVTFLKVLGSFLFGKGTEEELEAASRKILEVFAEDLRSMTTLVQAAKKTAALPLSPSAL